MHTVHTGQYRCLSAYPLINTRKFSILIFKYITTSEVVEVERVNQVKLGYTYRETSTPFVTILEGWLHRGRSL